VSYFWEKNKTRGIRKGGYTDVVVRHISCIRCGLIYTVEWSSYSTQCQTALFKYCTIKNKKSTCIGAIPPELVHASVKVLERKRSPLVNDCDLLAWFSDFCVPFSHLTLSVGGGISELSGSYLAWAAIWCKSHSDRLSQSFGHNTSTWHTATSL